MSFEFAVHDEPDLDFLGHRGVSVHPYPATMPLPLAEYLIEANSAPEDTVLDPFVGSGTTLVAALKLGRSSTGIDLNPLACLIARVSVYRAAGLFDPLRLNGIRSRILEGIDSTELRPDSGHDARLNRWFTPATVRTLSQLAASIVRADLSSEELDVALVVFSRTVRTCSLARPGELKLWRRPEEVKLPEPLDSFQQEFLKFGRDMVTGPQADPGQTARVIHGDSGRVIDTLDQVDLVLTSPPYGDAWTTVAYGNFTMLSRIWLGAIDGTYVESDPAAEDRLTMGGSLRDRLGGDLARSHSPTLRTAYHSIYQANPDRAEELRHFCEDTVPVWQALSTKLAPNGKVVLVVGPRLVSGVPVDTGLIFSEILEGYGLSRVARQLRRVTGKRLPSRASHRGELEDNINVETIDTLVVGA